MTVQMRTVEFQVPGLVDGSTPAPELSFDPRSPLYKAADADGIVRFTPAEMIALTGGNLGLFDPDFLMGGTFADRFTELLEVVTAGGAAIASIQVVDSEGLVVQQELVLGPEGNYYDNDLILVPQGSALRFSGYTATPAQPVVIRISVVAFTSIDDYADLRLVSCCSGGGTPTPPSSDIGPTFVYRPGGVAGENVYTDFPTLTAALALLAGPKWVEVDDSFVAIPLIPAGVWDVNGATFQSLTGSDQTVLRGSPGARLTNIFRIQGTLQLQNFDPAGATISLAGAEVFDVADGASLASLAGAPVIDVPGVGTAVLRLYASELANLGLGPAVGVSGGAGSGLLIQLWEGSTVNNDTVSSAVGAIVTAQMRSSASNFNRDQTPLLGGLVFTYFVPDQQSVVLVGGGFTLPVLGYAAITGDVLLPFAIQSQGPIHVENRDSVPHSVSAQVGDSVDALAAKVLPPGGVCVFKSNGLLAWITEEKTFVNYDALGMPIPAVTDITDFGDVANQWRGIHNRLDVRVATTLLPGFQNPPTLTYNPDAVGELSVLTVGYGTGLTEIYSSGTFHNIRGRCANFDAGGTVSRLRNTSTGWLEGNVYMYGGAIGDISLIENASVASHVGGYALVAYQEGSAIIRHATGSAGARTRAYALVNAGSPVGATAIVEVTGFNDVFVAAYHEARVYARPGASVFRGSVVGLHAGQYALMENALDAFACLIHGRVQTLAGYNAIMRTEDEAGWVTGRTNGGLMETRTGVACWVRGFAEAGATIYAQGHGSTAWGRAAAGETIGVAANNADQWGVGINTLADSSRFGVGWRMKKTVGAPAVPANGDCWIGAGGSMYVHTNGATKNLDAI